MCFCGTFRSLPLQDRLPRLDRSLSRRAPCPSEAGLSSGALSVTRDRLFFPSCLPPLAFCHIQLPFVSFARDKLSNVPVRLLCLFCILLVTPANSLTQQPRHFLILSDRLSWSDFLTLTDPIPRLLKIGSLALMSGSCLELTGGPAVWASIGAGRRLSHKDIPQPPLPTILSSHRISFSVHGTNAPLRAMGLVPTRHPGFIGSPLVKFIWTPKERLSQTVSHVLMSLKENDWLWIIVANSPSLEWTERQLTPFVLYRPRQPGGLVTSQTTRRTGLISSIDVVPTLLSALFLPVPSFMTGSPLNFVAHPDPVSYLTQMDKESQRVLRTLPYLTAPLVALIAGAFLFTLLSFRYPVSALARWFILSGMCLPLALFTSFFKPPLAPPFDLARCFISAFILGFAFSLWKRDSLAVARLIGATTALAALFLLPAYSRSPLGYFVTTGWRFYGISNSGVGLILAGSLLFLSSRPLPRHALLGAATVVSFLTGVGFWGANYGGALTLSLSLFLFAFHQPRHLVTPLSSFLSLLFSILLLQTIFIAERLLTPLPSGHIRHFLDWLSAGDRANLLPFLLTKARLWLLFSHSLPLATLVIIVFLILTASFPLLINAFRLHHYKPLFTFLFIGSWIGFFTNDSGVEILGMTLIYVGGYTLLLILNGLCQAPKGSSFTVWTGGR